MPMLAERQIAVLGSDSNNDTAPSVAEGVGFPVHVVRYLTQAKGSACAIEVAEHRLL